MKIKFTLLFCFVSFSVITNCISQVSTFQKDLCSGYCNYAFEAPDSGYIYITHDYYNYYAVKFDLSLNFYSGGNGKLDTGGITLFEYCAQSNTPCPYFNIDLLVRDSIYFLKTQNENACTGNTPLSKIDDNDSLIWSNTYPYPGFGGQNLYLTSGIDTSYLLLTSNQILKIDTSGNMIWVKNFNSNISVYPPYTQVGNTNTKLCFLQATSDTGFIIFRSLFDSTGHIYEYLQSIKFDANGDSLWSRNYYFPFVTYFAKTNDNGFVFTANDSAHSYIIKMDSSLDSSWTKVFSFDRFNSIEQTNDGGYVIASGSYIKIIKTDAIGDTVWTKTYHGLVDTLYDAALYAHQAYDNGYFIAGFRDGQSYFYSSNDGEGNIQTSSGYASTSILYKTDSLGNIFHFLGVSPIKKDDFNLTIFPDPVVGDEVTFSYNVSPVAGVISIYDVEGRVVAEYNLPQWSSVQRLRLPEMASGVYVARLVSGGYEGNVRFVKE